MKNWILSILACLSTWTAQAQVEQSKELVQPNDTLLAGELQPVQSLAADTLSVPLVSPVVPPSAAYSPFSMYGVSPFSYHGFGTWELHKGFNASLGMSLTFSPSKYAPSGVGFGQDAAFLYALPLSNRVSIAGGLYASNMDWGRYNCRTIGVAGIAAFKVNERISIYAYGNKSIMPKRSPLYYPTIDFNPDRLGGLVNFKLGESSSISVGVEAQKYSYLP